MGSKEREILYCGATDFKPNIAKPEIGFRYKIAWNMYILSVSTTLL